MPSGVMGQYLLAIVVAQKLQLLFWGKKMWNYWNHHFILYAHFFKNTSNYY